MVKQKATAVLSSLGGFATRPWNVIANLVSVIGLVVMLLAIIRWDHTWILAGYLCGMSLFLLLRYVRQERWSRYAEANVVMERGLRRLKEVSDRQADHGSQGLVVRQSPHAVADRLSAANRPPRTSVGY